MLLLMVLAGCSAPSKPTPDQVREKTAQATADFKSNAKAIAQGIREGLSSLDLNSATKDQLMALPGVDAATANRIIARRPYERKQDLVSKRAVTQTQYDKFADRVKVK
ncbi:MAG: helix-hairpin-helix domain-containing protein [Acidobacteriaceae bacterium]